MIAAPPSRNDPCPCGSGRRYKHCHGALADGAAAPAASASDAPHASARAALVAGRHAEALATIDSHLAAHSDDEAAQRLRGEILLAVDPAAAERAWRAIAHRHDRDAEAHFQLGNLARARGDHAAAIGHYEIAARSAPRNGALQNNLGLAYEAVQRHADAEACFRSALRDAASGFHPLANLAQNLYQQKRHGEALPLFVRLTDEFGIDMAAIWANRAICHRECREYRDAIECLKRALALDPGVLSLWHDLLQLALETNAYDEALPAYEAIRARDPSPLLIESDLLLMQMHCVVWDELAERRSRQLALAQRRLEGNAGASDERIQPFHFELFCDDPAAVLAVARSAASAWPAAPAAARAHGARPAKIRLGFAASHFDDHPVPRLLVSLLEHLDRRRFDVLLYATGPNNDDATLARMRAASSAYRVASGGFGEIADRIRADAVDVLFDLNGYTETELVPALVRRPAPVQVNFLGFTGTMGCRAYDYIVADRCCVGEGDDAHYSERPLYIDPCYLPSDPSRAIDPAPLRRSDYGLPEGSFVCCAMGNTSKLLPELFDVWMKLLRDDPSAVLWLRGAIGYIQRNLRKEASARGVDPARLHFAPHEIVPRYLARFRLADLFLDTVPFGSHTTVNDALYAGVPVLTVRGRCFHSRASASQLVAAGLDELVASDLDDYAARARRMREDAQWRQRMAERTLAARSSALFDIARYVRQFEACVERAVAEGPRGTAAR
jgi:predicted O-linked N-acetylglucosamine transferase (SPINDLY family)